MPWVLTDSLTAIDVHVHIEADGHGHYSLDDELMAASAKYFRADHDRTPTLPQIADEAAAYTDVVIPFGSVDPLRGAAAVAQARSLVRDHGVRGFKFHPSLQRFSPDDQAYYPLWAEIESLGVPALFHTGQTGIGAGLPGGRGIKLRLSNPMLLDDVAADFPGLTVILAHPSVPWADASISMATHKSNVYIDLSGWSPKYFPPALVRAANSYLQDKVLFGTDYPLLTPERWLRDFDTLDLKPDVRPKILKDNAVRVLGLAGTAP